jgi:hypothetical protein
MSRRAVEAITGFGVRGIPDAALIPKTLRGTASAPGKRVCLSVTPELDHAPTARDAAILRGSGQGNLPWNANCSREGLEVEEDHVDQKNFPAPMRVRFRISLHVRVRQQQC